MLGAAEALGKSCLRITVRLREDLEAERVAQAWVRQLAARPALCMRLRGPALAPEGDAAEADEDAPAAISTRTVANVPEPFSQLPFSRQYRWERIPDHELRTLIDAERIASARPEPAEDLERCARDPHALPFRLRIVLEKGSGTRLLVALVDPVFTNEIGGAAWIEDWLGFYGSPDGSDPKLAPALQTIRLAPKRKRLLEHLMRPVYTLGWSLRHLRSQLLPLGKAVDLNLPNANSDGPTPAPASTERFLTWRHVFTAEETRTLLRGPQARRRTLTVQLLVACGRMLLDADPRRRQARIALGTDFAPWMREIRRSQPGNSTCCVDISLQRGAPMVAQARSACRRLNRGITTRMRTRLLSMLKHEGRFLRKVTQSARKQRLQHAPITHASLRLSNLGRHAELRRLERDAEWMSVATPAPSLSLTAVLVSSTLSLELCFSDQRHDVQRVLDWAAKLPELLKQGPGD